ARAGGLLGGGFSGRAQGRRGGIRLEGFAGLRSCECAPRAECGGGFPGRLGFAGLLCPAIRPFPPGPQRSARPSDPRRIASLDAVVASHYVNQMLGNVGKPGGVLPPAASAAAAAGNQHAVEALGQARVVLIEGANPAYTLPRASGVLEALARAEMVISFAGFL